MSLRLRECILNNDIKGLQLLGNARNTEIDESGYTPLYFACMKRSVGIDTIRALLNFGASVDLKGNDDETPLYIAVFNKRLAVARLLVDKGANVDELNGPRKETALHAAARFGYEEIITWLLENHANINAQDIDFETPLFAAARAGRHNSAYLLLAAGADESLSNKDGKTPLYIASELKYKHVVIVLKASKANLIAAKAAADAELQLQPLRMPSTNEILNRSTVDEAYRSDMRRRYSAPPKAPDTTPMVLREIKVPLHKVQTRDPLTGKSYGPCRSLEEVGYDEPPPIPAELQNLPPPELPRYGGTKMVVGTGTNDGGREPIRVDSLTPDPVVYIGYDVVKND